MAKKRIHIPLVTRTMIGVIGMGGMSLTIPGFFVGIEELFRCGVTHDNYRQLLLYLGIPVVAVLLLCMSLTPRFKFRDDTEEELDDWDFEHELFMEGQMRRRSANKKKLRELMNRLWRFK